MQLRLPDSAIASILSVIGGIGLALAGFNIRDFQSPLLGSLLLAMASYGFTWLGAKYLFGDLAKTDANAIQRIGYCALSAFVVGTSILLWSLSRASVLRDENQSIEDPTKEPGATDLDIEYLGHHSVFTDTSLIIKQAVITNRSKRNMSLSFKLIFPDIRPGESMITACSQGIWNSAPEMPALRKKVLDIGAESSVTGNLSFFIGSRPYLGVARPPIDLMSSLTLLEFEDHISGAIVSGRVFEYPPQLGKMACGLR